MTRARSGYCGSSRKGVIEDGSESVGGRIVGVKGDFPRILKAEGPQVVHAENVVGMGMGVEDRIHVIDAVCKCLRPEVGASVDHDAVPVPDHGSGGPGAAVVRVGRGADAAIAAESGHAHRGAAAEDDKSCFHSWLKSWVPLPFL